MDSIHRYIEHKQNYVSSLNCLYLNARSVANKFTKVKDLVSTIKGLDIIIVTETWLNCEDGAFFHIQGFNAFFASRLGRGGGVTVFVRESIKVLDSLILRRKQDGIGFDVLRVDQEVH